MYSQKNQLTSWAVATPLLLSLIPEYQANNYGTSCYGRETRASGNYYILGGQDIKSICLSVESHTVWSVNDVAAGDLLRWVSGKQVYWCFQLYHINIYNQNLEIPCIWTFCREFARAGFCQVLWQVSSGSPSVTPLTCRMWYSYGTHGDYHKWAL